MRRLPRSVVLALASALALVPRAAAAEDVLVLDNGREIRGRIVEEREDAVRIDIGGGTMTYRRAQIRTVHRGEAQPAAASGGAAASQPGPAARREEHSLLYADGVRVGTRVFRSSRLPDGWLFEEEVVHLDAKGVPVREVRTSERADPDLLPVSFQVRETAPSGEPRSFSGEMRAGRLHVVRAKSGERERTESAAPSDARFPFALRELFLRESKTLSGRFRAHAFDAATAEWELVDYEEAERRPVRLGDRNQEVRVVRRRRGARAETEWIADDLAALLADLDGPALRALSSTKGAVERLRDGDTERVTGADSAARTRYADRERGFRIGKPDPSWTFELPAVRGTGAVLVVRNEPLFASVDVLLDPAARPGTTVEAAAEALQRTCRAAASDFTVLRDGFAEKGGVRVYAMEARATTKGETTRTLGRVVVRDGKVWRLLAACPDAGFSLLRGELESILDSFALD